MLIILAIVVVILNAVTRADLSHKQAGGGIHRALGEENVSRQTAKIKEEPAFRRLAALPDEELRALAAGAGGRTLANRFIRELAQEQAAQVPQPQNPDAVRPQGWPERQNAQDGLQVPH